MSHSFDTWKGAIDYLQKKINSFQDLEKDQFPKQIDISIYFEDGLINNMYIDYFYSDNEESQTDDDQTNKDQTPELRKAFQRYEIPEKFKSLFKTLFP